MVLDRNQRLTHAKLHTFIVLQAHYCRHSKEQTNRQSGWSDNADCPVLPNYVCMYVMYVCTYILKSADPSGRAF